MKKKIISLLLVLSLLMSIVPFTVFAQDTKEEGVYISIDVGALGINDVTIRDKVEKNENAAKVLVDFLKNIDMTLSYTGTIDKDFSLVSIDYTNITYLDELLEVVDIPENTFNNIGDKINYNHEGLVLANGDFSKDSRWMATINNKPLEKGKSLSDIYLDDGDVLRIQFSLDNGKDIGIGEKDNYGKNVDKSELIKVICNTINSFQENYNELYFDVFKVYTAYLYISDIDVTEEEVKHATDFLNEFYAENLNQNIIIKKTSEIINGRIKADNLNTPVFYSEFFLENPGSSETNWLAMNLKSFVEKDISGFFDFEYERYIYDGVYGSEEYYNALEDYVTKMYKENNGKLSEKNLTEWHRIALTVASIGGDPTNFGTYKGRKINLINDGVFNPVINPDAQGINAWIWALTTLNSNDYKVPKSAKYTAEDIIDEILKKQLPNGGWTFWGEDPEVDTTAMVITALAPYYYSNNKVETAVNKGIKVLSESQVEDGSFTAYGTANSMSTAQVIIAMSSLGIDIVKDERFITEAGKTAIDGLLVYEKEDNTFSYDNSMFPEYSYSATDQATQALISYFLFLNHDGYFYDYSNKYIYRGYNIGDANCDGSVNIKDATAIQKHVAEIEDLSAEGMMLADVNNDGVVNITDATLIQKHLVGIVDLDSYFYDFDSNFELDDETTKPDFAQTASLMPLKGNFLHKLIESKVK